MGIAGAVRLHEKPIDAQAGAKGSLLKEGSSSLAEVNALLEK